MISPTRLMQNNSIITWVMDKTGPRKNQIRSATLTLVLSNRKQNHELHDLFRILFVCWFVCLQVAVPEEGQ